MFAKSARLDGAIPFETDVANSVNPTQKPALNGRQINELISLVEGDLKAKWDEAMLYQMSDEIEAFARLLKNTGEIYQIDDLVKKVSQLFSEKG